GARVYQCPLRMFPYEHSDTGESLRGQRPPESLPERLDRMTRMFVVGAAIMVRSMSVVRGIAVGNVVGSRRTSMGLRRMRCVCMRAGSRPLLSNHQFGPG